MPVIRVKDQISELKMLLVSLSLRKLQGLLQLYARNWVKDYVLEQKIFLAPCLQGFQEPCVRNQGQRPVHVFLLISQFLSEPPQVRESQAEGRGWGLGQRRQDHL